MKIQKGDTVKVLKGKDVGKKGKVLKVLPNEQKLVVEGVNVYKKHKKAGGQKDPGGIVDMIKPTKASNVMVICPVCKKPTRIGIKREGKKRTRLCKKCQKDI